MDQEGNGNFRSKCRDMLCVVIHAFNIQWQSLLCKEENAAKTSNSWNKLHEAYGKLRYAVVCCINKSRGFWTCCVESNVSKWDCYMKKCQWKDNRMRGTRNKREKTIQAIMNFV